jgi:hypothetical protein
MAVEFLRRSLSHLRYPQEGNSKRKQSHLSPAPTSDTSNSPKKGRKPPGAPTPEKQAKILALLREGRMVEGARRSIGINGSSLYPECG